MLQWSGHNSCIWKGRCYLAVRQTRASDVSQNEFEMIMKTRQWFIVIVLLLLVAAAIAGFVWTRALPAANEETSATPGRTLLGRKTPVAQHPPVDQRPLETARRMSALAGTRDMGVHRGSERQEQGSEYGRA